VKIAKLIFFTFIVISLGFVIIFASVATWAYRNPSQAWPHIENYFLPSDFKATGNIDLKIRRLSGLSFNLIFKVDGLEIKKRQPTIDLSIESTLVDVSFFPFQNQQKIVINNFELSSMKNGFVQILKTENSNPTNPFQQIQSIQPIFFKKNSWVLIKAFFIEIKNLQFENPDMTTLGIAFSSTKNLGDENISFDSDVTLPSSIKMSSIGELTLKNDQIFLSASFKLQDSKVFIEQKIQGSIGELTKMTSVGVLRIKIEKMMLKANSITQLTLNSKGLTIHNQSKIDGLSNAYSKLNSVVAEVHLPFKKNTSWSSQNAEFSIDFPITFLVKEKKVRSMIEKSCHCQLAQVLNAEIQGRLWTSNVFQNDSELRTIASAKFNVDTIENDLFDLKLNGTAEVKQKNGHWTVTPLVNFNLNISHFNYLSKILDSYQVLVPAPLDILDGPLRISMVGSVDLSKKGIKFPISVSAKLNSEKQIVDVSMVSVIFLDQNFKKAKINAKLTIHRLVLELPPLTPTKGTPRIISDQRIQVQPARPKQQSKISLNFNYQIVTENPGTIHLLSEYFKPYLPLTIQLTDRPDQKGTSSFVLGNFDIEYLRRKNDR
jgi:hypothetical protein